jgi:hypothetical protein
MIVLGESNFVLELAFQQEEARDVESIVVLAEHRAIELVIPACALNEPYETLVRRRKERSTTLEKLRNELRQLVRSREFAELAETSKAVTGALAASGESEARGLDATIRRLLACATVPPLSRSTIVSALEAQARFQLEPQDAVVFASVDEYLRDLPEGPKVFINKNYHDFLKPDIEDYFQGHGCKLLPKFASARQFIEHAMRG